jgi:DNA-binding MarR family transcriptional regulator
MSKHRRLSLDDTRRVRDECFCLHAQRAARALARRYDEALRPIGLTSGQFSLMTALSRPEPVSIGELSSLLVMDRTTITANLKPLRRRGLVAVTVDPDDRRSRRPTLTSAGRSRLADALPIWKRVQKEVERALDDAGPDRVRADLKALS